MKDIHEMIGSFLKERRESVDGELAEATTEDIKELGAIIERLIEQKFDKNRCEALPVKVLVYNETTHMMPFKPIPRVHKDRTEKEMGSIERTIWANFEAAYYHINNWFKTRAFERIREEAPTQTAAWLMSHVLDALPTKRDWLDPQLEEMMKNLAKEKKDEG